MISQEDICWICNWECLYFDSSQEIRWNIARALGKSLRLSPWNFPHAQDIFHRISLLLTQYRYNINYANLNKKLHGLQCNLHTWHCSILNEQLKLQTACFTPQFSYKLISIVQTELKTVALHYKLHKLPNNHWEN